jgi:hypothetical protein
MVMTEGREVIGPGYSVCRQQAGPERGKHQGAGGKESDVHGNGHGAHWDTDTGRGGGGGGKPMRDAGLTCHPNMNPERAGYYLVPGMPEKMPRAMAKPGSNPKRGNHHPAAGTT